MKKLVDSKEITFKDSENARKFCEALREVEDVAYFAIGNKVRVKTFSAHIKE